MTEGVVVGSERVALPAVADLVQIGPMKGEIEHHLAAGMTLEIDASQVQRVSSQYFQVLVAAVTAFAKAGGPSLKIVGPSQAFVETATTLGLAEALGLE